MEDDCRKSEIDRRQSRRRTLLCCSTLCLVLVLILFLILTKFFHQHFIFLNRTSNETIALNLMKYRSSLIECGQSVVQYEQLDQILEQIKEMLQYFKQTKSSLNQQWRENLILKEEILLYLEYLLSKCFRARQFSILEQEKPNFIRKILSILRKEFLYIATFFIKEI